MQLEANKRRGRFPKTALWQSRPLSEQQFHYHAARSRVGVERMRSSIASPVIGADMRPVYETNEHNTRMNQLEQKRKAQKVSVKSTWTREGIRATLAYGIIILLAVVFGCVLLAGRYEVLRVENQNRKILSRVDDTQRKCVKLQEQIEETESNLFVGYAAVDLGLVSDNGVEKMVLTAPADAIVLPQSRQIGSR